MNVNQCSQLILTSLLASKHAGEAILDVYKTDFTVDHKADNSPLTLADKRAHEIIMNALNKPVTFDNGEHNINNALIPVLSEEGRNISYDERKKWDLFWLVDPLDGTKDFVKKNGEFTVNIALISRNRPILGFIYVPVKDVFYFAAEGLGSYRLTNSKIVTSKLTIEELLENSQKLPLKDKNNEVVLDGKLSTANKNTSITVIGSRSHETKEQLEFTEKINDKYEEVKTISAGSSLKFCFVAEGTADVYPRYGPTMEWDTGAGQAIVEQAEGCVIDMQELAPLKYNKENLLNPFFFVSKQRSLIEHILKNI